MARHGFVFADLFAGIGGFRLALEAIGGKCVFTSERNRYCQETYGANFPGDEHEIVGDIKTVRLEDIPPHDVLAAGFPCQPFSQVGVSHRRARGKPHGFSCLDQGNLFFRIADIIDSHRPDAVLLENVKNLVKHDKRHTFQVILNVLVQDLGYYVDWRIVNSMSWVPQRRERVFIAAFRDRRPFSFLDMIIPDPLGGPKLATILHPEDGTEAPEPPYTEGEQAKVSPRYTLTENMWLFLQAHAKRQKARGNGFSYSTVGKEDTARTLLARYGQDGAEILVRQEDRPPRRLTPRECSRLMGYDFGARKFIIPVSDRQAYTQFGNGLVVPAAEAVARHMQPHICPQGR